MNSEPDKTPRVSDQQMDELLTAFFRAEVPEDRLSTPPSVWMAQRTADTSPQSATETAAAFKRGTNAGLNRPTRRVARVVAVAVTTAAACLMMIVFSRPAADSPGTADSRHDAVLDNETTINVSADGDTKPAGAAAREDDTTWDEILNSDAPPTPSGQPNRDAVQKPQPPQQ